MVKAQYFESCWAYERWLEFPSLMLKTNFQPTQLSISLRSGSECLEAIVRAKVVASQADNSYIAA